MNEPFRLFVVDDNEEVAFLMRLHLERAGHDVTICRTAADALIVLAQDPYHLVLLDDHLPDMRGVKLLQRLAGDGIQAPVLLTTAYGDEKAATQALLAGAIDYLVKDSALTFLTELPKRVEEAVTRRRLQDANQRLVAALESARDGICIADLVGTMLHVNTALVTMTGYDRHELIGRHPHLVKTDSPDRESNGELWHTILARKSWQGELLKRRKDGKLVDISLTVSPILDGRGQQTHFVGIFRDISERKQLERQLLHAQKMQSVGTLAGGVAHEFNNLLAGIQGYAALGLREAGTSPELKQFLQFIVELSDRAANLTRQLLAFARKPALTRYPTNLPSLLNATAELVRHSMNVEVIVETPAVADGDQPLRALADANQLQQVLINLALNARDALSRPEPIRFRLEHVILRDKLAANPEDVLPGDYAVLEVRDAGKGMTAEVREHAFDPFFTTKEVGKGTGLGLPVAFGILHGHQGHLTLDSDVDRGTAVRLYLPRLVESPATASPSTSDTTALQPEQAPSRDILVVDDEAAVLDVVRRYLEIAGHRVTCVTTGAEAMRLLDSGQHFDLVVLDLMIPQEDGTTTFKQFRTRWPHLPILVCTGLLQTDAAAPSLGGEQVHLLRKPFRMNELWLAVNQALHSSPS
jgi:two-component system, cell cycle sensor histidine kinase and response regulator CckA